jgi:hypothetical protein
MIEGSGSGWPKYTWILTRIRIRNTDGNSLMFLASWCLFKMSNGNLPPDHTV